MFVSEYLHTHSYGDERSTIWHSVFGRPMLIPDVLVNHLLNSRNDNLDPKIAELYDGEVFETLREAHVIIDSKEQEQADIQELFKTHNQPGKSKVKALSLIMSEECPFRCKYCIHFANSKHYYNPEKMMSEEVARTAIGEYLKTIVDNGVPAAYINFGGGEPLVNYHTIAKLLPHIDACREKLGIPIRISINTNLALLTEEMAATFIKYDVEIATSLDGTKEGNDKVRLTKNLEGTYDQILRGFDILEKLGRPMKSFAMTVTEANFSDVDIKIIDWAASKNMEEVRIDIDVVGFVDIPIKEVAARLMEVRTYAKTKGISVVGFWSRAAENLGLIPENDDVGFCGGERGNSACVTPSGQVFPCGYSNYQIGNFDSISRIQYQNPYQKLLGRRNLNLPHFDKCRNCPIFGFCRGGCLITTEANEGSGKQATMCELYVAMTKAIINESVEA